MDKKQFIANETMTYYSNTELTHPDQSIQAVIFDCDGVLVDSTKANTATYQNLLLEAGYDTPNEEAVLACYNLDLHDTLCQLTGTGDRDEITRIQHLLTQPGIRQPQHMIFPAQLRSTLGLLASEYKIGLATNRSRMGLADVFTMASIEDLFGAIVIREDYAEPKPNPSSLLLAAAALGVATANALYVGDSDSDMVAANAANMRAIHVTSTGHRLATRVVNHLFEVPGAVKSISRNG